jgi:uncharacterized protein
MSSLPEETRLKLQLLKKQFTGWENVAVAFSGGVDSTLLLKVASEVLGENAVAVYCDSPLQAKREKKAALNLVRGIGVELFVIKLDKLDHEAFRKNPTNRCYLCKGLVFDAILKVTRLRGISVVVDGSNHDDKNDLRPGAKALKEKGIVSPLQDAALTKEEIRIISKFYRLPTWDKDALACLATRIPFGEEVNLQKLKMIDRAEEFLVNRGFRNVRARHMGTFVRLEVKADQIKQLMSEPYFEEVKQEMVHLGFQKVVIDLEGYQQGRMNKL